MAMYLRLTTPTAFFLSFCVSFTLSSLTIYLLSVTHLNKYNNFIRWDPIF